MREKYKRILLFVIIFIFLVGSNVLSDNQMLHNKSYVNKTCPQSEDAINQLKNIMYEISFTNPQEQRSLDKVSEKPEQYRFGSNFNKRILLFYSLLEGLLLLGLEGAIYILNMRNKVVNYLLAIIYIHKSDGQKERKYILLSL